MTDVIQQFREALSARGIEPPDEIEADGRIHRCDMEGKRGKKGASYLLHLDGTPAGGFQNWADGLGWQNWGVMPESPLTPAEKAAYRARIEASRKEREAEEVKRHKEAQRACAAIWNGSRPCNQASNHSYLLAKSVQAHGLREAKDGRLLVPVRADGKLCSLQFIDADGNKRFKTGSRVEGGYFSIGKPDGVLCIAEGYATAASIHEATGHAVAVAFDAGNLKPVAQALRTKFPDLTLILCADDDWRTEGNPGLSKAKEAAHAVGGLLAVPDFGPDRPPDGATDFNDLHQMHGPDAVKTCIDAAMATGSAVAGASDPPMGEPSPGTENPSEADSEVHSSSDELKIARLSKLSAMDYERVRTEEAKRLGMRASVLDKIVAKERQRAEADKGIGFDEVDPWPEAVAGDGLLSDLAATIARFIVCKPETIHAATLWLVMTWLIDEVDTAPLAVITAPEKRCGKSQLLTIMGRLSRRPVVASNISPVALFRVIDAWQPTLMIDEADAFMRENEELRGIINSGHKRDSAYVVRAVGEDFVPKQFSTWGAKAIAGIGHLADTLMDRAIVLDLRRKLPHENVERLRYAEPGLFDDLASRLCRFAEDNRDAVRRARPDLPQTLNDRQQDNWEPLLAIADVVGGVWPEQARHAALVISGSGDDTLTLGAELLFDIQEVFETKHIDRIGTADLIAALIEDDEKPWATYNRGKPVSPRQIAKRLKEYGISSKTIRIGYETQKGFEKNQFSDAFIRYLTYPENVRNNVTNPQESINHAACSVTDMKNTYVTKSANPSQRNKSATEGYQSEAIGTGGHQSGAAGTEGHQSAKIPQPCGLQRSGQSEKNVTDTSVTLQALPAQGLSGVKEKCDGRTRAYVTLEPSNGKGCDVVTDKNGGENDRNVFEGLHVTHLPDGRIEVEI